MRLTSIGHIALFLTVLGSGAHPAQAQTITWVTPPPATVGSGGQFTVEWQVSGFTEPFLTNAVAWGQTTLLGQVPGVDQGGGVYTATVTAPMLDGPVGVVVVAETAADGQVLSPMQTVTVSAFQAIAQLQATVMALVADNAELRQYLEVDTHNGQPVIRFTGVNVQIVDGTGDTYAGPTDAQPNGLGNLIIGYDEQRDATAPSNCSDGVYSRDQKYCEDNGGIWALNHKTGAHTLVVGAEHNYSQYGGAVLGQRNIVNASAASVSGGYDNEARNVYTSISGGYENVAWGPHASVSGGLRNSAFADATSVSGGVNNLADGDYASVSGGTDNTAHGRSSSVSGGSNNTANGQYASVSGGRNNRANGQGSSLAGGSSSMASGQYASVNGGWNNLASGDYASVSGGDDLDNAVDGTVLGEGTILPAD